MASKREALADVTRSKRDLVASVAVNEPYSGLQGERTVNRGLMPPAGSVSANCALSPTKEEEEINRFAHLPRYVAASVS